MNFEIIFKENIVEYINKITSKIKTISDFELIIKLINIKNISEKNIYLDSLNKKYDTIIKPKIESLTGDQLNEAIKVVAKIALINTKNFHRNNKNMH
jgi:aspartyl/asparaginyl-tRNA synthetase